VHYGPGKRFSPQACTFDIWPDLSEFTPEERYPSPFKFADGKTADLFSSVQPQTVRRHFRWMKDYGIDGAMLQRFAVGLGKGRGAESLDVVLRNCTEAAVAEGRSLTVMYDLSGLTPDKFPMVAADWRRPGRRRPRRSNPAPSIIKASRSWPCGASASRIAPRPWRNGALSSPTSRPRAPRSCSACRPTGANSRTTASPTRPSTALLRQADILSPWTVGRYGDPKGAANLAAKVWQPDLAGARPKRKPTFQ
jgi:hypothetical protein